MKKEGVYLITEFVEMNILGDWMYSFLRINFISSMVDSLPKPQF